MDEEREKDWHEEAPRIIASGRWEQDEYGDTTYIPDHVRPSTAERAETADAPRGHDYEDPAPRDGYRVHPERSGRRRGATIWPGIRPRPSATAMG